MLLHEHYAPGFSSYEEVEEALGPIYDATTLDKVATCPRKHEVRVEMGLDPSGPANPPMVSGIALHAGLEYYYAHAERTSEVEKMAQAIATTEWDEFGLIPTSFDQKYAHLNGPFLSKILANYFFHWNHKRIEIYEPLVVRLEDLNLEDVLAAKFLLTEKEEVILGESKLVMQFDLGGPKPFILAGKPDLPVINQNGSVWAMDHKSTGQYLSDWWARNFEVSNQLRGYMAMLWKLLGRRPEGAIINGIHFGKAALNPESKAAKFARFEFNFTEGHIWEALHNQQAWANAIEHFRSSGYWPQGCGYGGCDMPHVCKREPEQRPLAYAEHFEPSTRSFWTL